MTDGDQADPADSGVPIEVKRERAEALLASGASSEQIVRWTGLSRAEVRWMMERAS